MLALNSFTHPLFKKPDMKRCRMKTRGLIWRKEYREGCDISGCAD
jgi:hypothetical protein